MTRAQAVLAAALNIRDGAAIPAYVQRRAAELDWYLQRSRLPAEHPVARACAFGILQDWAAVSEAAGMRAAALETLEALGEFPPAPPDIARRGSLPRAAWTLLSEAATGRPDAASLPEDIAGRADEIIWLLRAERLPANHPAVRAHAAAIVRDYRCAEAASAARLAAQALRAWQDRPAWRRVLDALIAVGPGRQAPAPPAPQAGGKPNAPGRPAAATAAPDQQEVWTTVKKWFGIQ